MGEVFHGQYTSLIRIQLSSGPIPEGLFFLSSMEVRKMVCKGTVRPKSFRTLTLNYETNLAKTL
jgi:hypothetical protein